jgi:quinol monooxygenase YgiN
VGAVLIRGTLAGDPATAEAAHNAAAEPIKAMANAAGDVGHLVYLDPQDPQSFIVIDLWKDVSVSQAFYASPAFQQGLSKVLAGPPTATAYAPTTWAQW